MGRRAVTVALVCTAAGCGWQTGGQCSGEQPSRPDHVIAGSSFGPARCGDPSAQGCAAWTGARRVRVVAEPIPKERAYIPYAAYTIRGRLVWEVRVHTVVLDTGLALPRSAHSDQLGSGDRMQVGRAGAQLSPVIYLDAQGRVMTYKSVFCD